MSTVVKQWTWNTDIDGWSAVTDGWGSFSYDASGDPGGCARFDISVGSDSVEPFSEQALSRDSETWESWGVPAGATVTAVQLTAWKYKITAPSNITHKVYFCSILSGLATVATLKSNASLPGYATAWLSGSAGSSVSVGASYQASNTPVRLEWQYTGSVNISGGAATRFDTIEVTITYTLASDTPITPTPGHLTVTGHAPTVVCNPAIKAWTWPSDLDGWGDAGLDANVSVGYGASGYGGSGGCLDFNYASASATTFLERALSRDGETWESWGVPVGSVVTTVELVSLRYIITASSNVAVVRINAIGVRSGDVQVTTLDLLHGVPITLSAGTWSPLTAGFHEVVLDSYQSSATPVRLAFDLYGICSAPSSCDVQFDDVLVRVYYVPGASASRTPTMGHVAASGHAPTRFIDVRLSPTHGAVSVSGHVPAVMSGDSRAAFPLTGYGVVTGHQPTLVHTTNAIPVPSTAHLIASGHSPTARITKAGISILVNGTDRTAVVDQPSRLRLLDSRNVTTPNLTFSVGAWADWVPSYGQRVEVTDGSDILFAGWMAEVQIARHVTDGNELWYYDCTAIAHRSRLTRTDPVYGFYQTATFPTAVTAYVADILTDIFTHLPSGFTHTHVSVSGTITEISFNGVSVDDALSQLAQAVGAIYYVDEDRDVHFYMDADPGMSAPSTVTENNCRDARLTVDASQLVTRQYVQGYNTATADWATNALPLIITNGVGADPSGGAVVVGKQQWLRYSSKIDFTPPGAPFGILGYQSALSNRLVASASRTGTTALIQTISAHGFSVGMTVKITGCSEPAYNGIWRVSATGDAYSFSFEIAGTPGSGSGGYAVSATSGNLTSNLPIQYCVTFAIGDGETLAGGTCSVSPPTAVQPPTVIGSLTPTTGGSMETGVHYYAIAFETAIGETAVVIALGVANLTGGQNAVALAGIPLGEDERVLHRKIYRSRNAVGPFRLCGTISDNTTTTWTDTISDANLGASSVSEYRAGYGAIALTNIATNGYSDATVRRIYRSLGGSRFFLVGTISNNVDTSWIDTGAEAGSEMPPLVSRAPAVLVGASADIDPAYPIPPGSTVSIVVQCDDLTAQAALAAITGDDGVRVGALIIDESLSAAAGKVRGDAELRIRAYPELRFSCLSLDTAIRAGQTITVNVNAAGDAPISGTFRITSCEFLNYDLGPSAQIVRKIEASSTRFTPSDLFRQWEASLNWRPMGYTGIMAL